MDLCTNVVNQSCGSRTCVNRKLAIAIVAAVIATSFAASFVCERVFISGEIDKLKEQTDQMAKQIEKLNAVNDLKNEVTGLNSNINKALAKGGIDSDTAERIKFDLNQIDYKLGVFCKSYGPLGGF